MGNGEQSLIRRLMKLGPLVGPKIARDGAIRLKAGNAKAGMNWGQAIFFQAALLVEQTLFSKVTHFHYLSFYLPKRNS